MSPSRPAKSTRRTGRKAPASKTAKKATRPVTRTAAKKQSTAGRKVATKKAAARPAAAKKVTRTSPAKKPAAKKVAAKKSAPKKVAAKKVAAKKSAPKKVAAKKVAAKKSAPKKVTAKKVTAKKVAATRPATRTSMPAASPQPAPRRTGSFKPRPDAAVVPVDDAMANPAPPSGEQKGPVPELSSKTHVPLERELPGPPQSSQVQQANPQRNIVRRIPR